MHYVMPPLRYFAYVLGTVNVIVAVVLLLASVVFSGGVNVVSVAFVVLAANVVSVAVVFREFRVSR